MIILHFQCVLYFRKTRNTNHITDWFHFRCCFSFGDHLQRMPLKNQLRKGHFDVLIGMLKFTGMIVRRNTNRKGQRTQLKSVERNYY